MEKLTGSKQAPKHGARSRGPVTPEGKARPARNSDKHGCYAKSGVTATRVDLLAASQLINSSRSPQHYRRELTRLKRAHRAILSTLIAYRRSVQELERSEDLIPLQQLDPWNEPELPEPESQPAREVAEFRMCDSEWGSRGPDVDLKEGRRLFDERPAA